MQLQQSVYRGLSARLQLTHWRCCSLALNSRYNDVEHISWSWYGAGNFAYQIIVAWWMIKWELIIHTEAASRTLLSKEYNRLLYLMVDSQWAHVGSRASCHCNASNTLSNRERLGLTSSVFDLVIRFDSIKTMPHSKLQGSPAWHNTIWAEKCCSLTTAAIHFEYTESKHS